MPFEWGSRKTKRPTSGSGSGVDMADINVTPVKVDDVLDTVDNLLERSKNVQPQPTQKREPCGCL